MSLSETINKMIKESQVVARECEWFVKALPQVCATEFMGNIKPGGPEDIQLHISLRCATQALH